MPNKSLGQHWLKDREILAAIADEAKLTATDTVLEIGPGLGTLTSELLRRAERVVAVEFDGELARKLPSQFPGKNLEVFNQDILQFDLSQLPPNYKVVANVPYYITSKIVEKLVCAKNKPSRAVLLVQKEVAQRIAAQPGDMSLLALSAQMHATARLGAEVKREYFTPPPKVDSAVVQLVPRAGNADIPVGVLETLTAAAFGQRRKMLRASLRGIHPQIESLLAETGIAPTARAEEIGLEQFCALARAVTKARAGG